MRLGCAARGGKENGGCGREKREEKEGDGMFKSLGTKGKKEEKMMRGQMRQ